MDPSDQTGTPDPELVRALAKPFAWPQSGLEPLPWFPFTVAASRGRTEVAARIARLAEHGYWHLRKLLGVTPRFRLMVLDRRDWPRFAEVATFGVMHFTDDGNLIVGAEPADAWRDIARELAQKLPASALRTLVKVHGGDRLVRQAPDLSGLYEALVVHEVARVLLDQSRVTFARAWMKDAFANYALVAVLGETDPGSLRRVGSLAEATRPLAAITPPVDALRADLAPFEALLVQLALTRAVYEAYAQAQDAPLARWFALARARRSGAPDADQQLGLLLAREVHAAIGALAAGSWRQPVLYAA